MRSEASTLMALSPTSLETSARLYGGASSVLRFPTERAGRYSWERPRGVTSSGKSERQPERAHQSGSCLSLGPQKAESLTQKNSPQHSASSRQNSTRKS